MSDVFATIYETWFGLFNSTYTLIFNHLFDNGGYIQLGLSFILIPLFCWIIFYFAWRYPYGKIWHWLVWLLITVIIVSGISYGIANTEIFASNNQALNNAIGNPSTGYDSFAVSLPLKYSLINGGLTLIIGFIFSLFMKQFSKIQIHLPF